MKNYREVSLGRNNFFHCVRNNTLLLSESHVCNQKLRHSKSEIVSQCIVTRKIKHSNLFKIFFYV